MKTALFILLVWTNEPDGRQVDVMQSQPMNEANCLSMQALVWASPLNVNSGVDYDAACYEIKEQIK